MQVQPGGRDAIGAVLAGGRGRRMGGAKALAELAGRPLIAYPLAAVEGAGLEPVVVAKPGTRLPRLGTRVIREPAQPTHPLCGILAVLGEGRPAVVLGCDMPFVPPDLLTWLAGLGVRVAVPRVGDRLEPFPARLEPGVAPALREALDRGAPLRETLAALRPRIVGEAELRRFGDPARITQSVNDPASLAAAERHTHDFAQPGRRTRPG